MSSPTLKDAERVVRQLGYPGFRPDQVPLVRSILRHRHVLGVQATGFGKTLCFQVPALLFPGTTLAISPNIALMENQVADLNSRMGSEVAACITSNQSPSIKAKLLSRATAGDFKLLYVAPERFSQPEFQLAIANLTIPMLVVDEAHSVLLDTTYREDYLRVGHFARKLGIPQIVAFTATCPKGFVTASVSSLLGLVNPIEFRGKLDRRNLHYSVQSFNDHRDKKAHLTVLLESLQRRGFERGYIYCSETEIAKEFSEFVNYRSFSSTYYHGKLSPSEKQHNQDLFLSGQAKIMVATKAFGQGIDIPDARFVIVYNTPANLIELTHLWGRVGRNGDQAHCFLLHDKKDYGLQQGFLEKNIENIESFLEDCPKSITRRFNLDRFTAYLERENQRIFRFVWDQSTCIRETLLHLQNRSLKNRPDPCCTNCG